MVLPPGDVLAGVRPRPGPSLPPALPRQPRAGRRAVRVTISLLSINIM